MESLRGVWSPVTLNETIPLARIPLYTLGFLVLIIILNAIQQVLLPRPKSQPPVVFHWLPFIGNAVSYGADPLRFFNECQQKHGDLFTFILFGRRMTVYLGTAGNDFILNGKRQDLNAEDIYSVLTTPVFGRDVVYDCPHPKFVEQKKFVKFGLTQAALESYVPLIEREVISYVAQAPAFMGQSGTFDVVPTMATITLFTAARALQGVEVRAKLTAEFADLYHDLDQAFSPINFLMPWAPLPRNQRRDRAHRKMRAVYMDIIQQRRERKSDGPTTEHDMITHLIGCAYKDGHTIPDSEIANMMLTMLMGGQHSSSFASAWTILRLAARPDIAEELYREQLSNLSRDADGRLRPLQHADLDKLPLLANVVKETLRRHSSIHSIMRKVTRPMAVPGTDYVVEPGSVLLAAPIATQMSEAHFPDAHTWDPHRWDEHEEVELSEDMVDYGYGLVNKGTRSPYLPFGAGRHRCIGEKFAYVNLGTIVATLVREFRFGTLDGNDAVPATDYTSLFSGPMAPATIRWERRQ